MINFNNSSLIFDENPISRAYLNLFVIKKIRIKELIYLGEKILIPIKIIQYFKFHRNNFYAIKFLKKKDIDYFLIQVEEFFGLDKNFIRNMYQFNNLYKINTVKYINNNKINSENLIKHVNSSSSYLFINTGRQILKQLLLTKKDFLHVHPAYLPLVRGADGSLHSIDRFNHIASSSFFINSEIDKGKIIYKEKKNFLKFKIKNKNDYSLKDLYNLWFSFVDPLLRASHLNNLLENSNIKNINDVKKETSDSKYYTFMNESDLDRVFKKIFE